jgi:hypothetical protein
MASVPDAEDDNLIIVRILWTTTNMCQPFASIAIKSEMDDGERANILTQIAEFIDTARKRKKETAEQTIGRTCEDHLKVMCNEMSFATVSKNNTIPSPKFVKWLCKTLPDAGILPRSRLKIAVAWMKPGTREIYEQTA